MSVGPHFSVIVPVYNGADTLARCLAAIRANGYVEYELIVVDDCSEDISAEIAQTYADKVVQTKQRSGPAFARNLGAQFASGQWLIFIDADCVTGLRTLAQIALTLCENPHADALFGSYDDAPAEPDFASQYKNLLHHYVHQMGRRDATSFWAGCGAMRRSLFEQLGGFDAAQFPQPSIEDIELGYRFKAAGASILLEPSIQVTHLKRWTLRSLLRTDIFSRALPWSRLLQRSEIEQQDLNVSVAQRVSVAVLFCSLLFAFIWLPITVVSLLTLLPLNYRMYRFMYEKRGLRFMMAAVIMHWIGLFYSGSSWLWVMFERAVESVKIGLSLE